MTFIDLRIPWPSALDRVLQLREEPRRKTERIAELERELRHVRDHGWRKPVPPCPGQWSLEERH